MIRNDRVIRVREHREWAAPACEWFHRKWGIPKAAYIESMDACVKCESAVPQWYLVVEDGRIIAGAGVIENDFHDRKDLTPNLCALCVEEDRRCLGIAGDLLQFIRRDMMQMGIDTLYLVTDHTSFYERYGWEFLCMVQGDGEPEMSRMYRSPSLSQKNERKSSDREEF